MMLYRWIKSSSSKLFDPALHRLIQGQMKKVFLQLLAELRRLGAQIVFANFNRVLISTTKTSVDNARGYCEYVLAAIKKKPLFQWLDVRLYKRISYFLTSPPVFSSTPSSCGSISCGWTKPTLLVFWVRNQRMQKTTLAQTRRSRASKAFSSRSPIVNIPSRLIF